MFYRLREKKNNNNNTKNFQGEGGWGGNHHLSYVQGLIISMALKKIVLNSRFLKNEKDREGR